VVNRTLPAAVEWAEIFHPAFPATTGRPRLPSLPRFRLARNLRSCASRRDSRAFQTARFLLVAKELHVGRVGLAASGLSIRARALAFDSSLVSRANSHNSHPCIQANMRCLLGGRFSSSCRNQTRHPCRRGQFALRFKDFRERYRLRSKRICNQAPRSCAFGQSTSRDLAAE